MSIFYIVTLMQMRRWKLGNFRNVLASTTARVMGTTARVVGAMQTLAGNEMFADVASTSYDVSSGEQATVCVCVFLSVLRSQETRIG